MVKRGKQKASLDRVCCDARARTAAASPVPRFDVVTDTSRRCVVSFVQLSECYESDCGVEGGAQAEQ